MLLYAFKSRGFGEEVGMNGGLAIAAAAPTTPTNHLQLKVSQVTVLTQEVCMGIHLI
jgi:hypothetical protein